MYLFCRDMVGGHLGQQAAVVTDNLCPYDGHPFALADKARLSPYFTAALVTQQVGIQINGQRKSLAFFTKLVAADSQHGGRDIGQPEHGSSMDGSKGIQCAAGYRHFADNTIFSAFFNKKFDLAFAFYLIDVLLDVFHLEHLRIFEKITDKFYFAGLHFQQGDAFILIGLVAPVQPLVGPMYSRPIILQNHTLNFKDQLRVLSKEDIEKFKYTKNIDKIWKKY